MAKIHDDLEELQKQLAEAMAADEKLEEPAEEPVEQEEPKEEAPQEPKEPSEEEKEEATREKTASEYRLQRKAKREREQELAAELAKKEAEIEALKRPQQSSADPEPDPEDEVAHLAWQVRDTKRQLAEVNSWREKESKRREVESIQSGAENEFARYEAKAKQSIPDYEAAAKHYTGVIAGSIQALYPSATSEQINAAVKSRLLQRAAELENEGWENPIEGMYEEAKRFGYKKADAQVETKEEPKPDLDKIKENKRRSAGTGAAAGGAKVGDVTLNTLATLKPKDLAKIPKSERAAVLKQYSGK